VTGFLRFEHRALYRFRLVYDDRDLLPPQRSFEGQRSSIYHRRSRRREDIWIEVLWSDQARHVGMIVWLAAQLGQKCRVKSDLPVSF